MVGASLEIAQHHHQTDGMLTNIHLFFACKICQYMTISDLLNYVCAVRPGGLANQLRDRIRPKRELLTKLCNDVSNMPLIGKPTSIVTNAVVNRATNLVNPIVNIVSKVPPDQILLWWLATAKCISNVLDSSETENNINIIEEENNTNNEREGEQHQRSQHQRNLTYDYSLRKCESSSLRYAEFRISVMIEELKEWVSSLARVLGMDIVLKILPIISTLGSGNNQIISSSMMIKNMFLNHTNPSIISSSNRIIKISEENEEENDEEDDENGLQPPPPTPHNEEDVVQREGLSSWVPLRGVTRAAQDRLVGTFKQWTPGGVVALYDYFAPTDLPRRDRADSILSAQCQEEGGRTPHASPPHNMQDHEDDEEDEELIDIADEDNVGGDSNVGGDKKNILKQKLSQQNLLLQNNNENISQSDKLNDVNDIYDKNKLLSELEMKIAYDKSVSLWLDEVSLLNEDDNMATIIGYRELIPNGLNYGDLTCFHQSQQTIHQAQHSHSHSERNQKGENTNIGEGGGGGGGGEGGLSKEDKELPAPVSPRSLRRMQRMMHYQVSLAPFQVTIVLKPSSEATSSSTTTTNGNEERVLSSSSSSSSFIVDIIEEEEDEIGVGVGTYQDDDDDDTPSLSLSVDSMNSSSSTPPLLSSLSSLSSSNQNQNQNQNQNDICLESLKPDATSSPIIMRKKEIKKQSSKFKSSLSENDLNKYNPTCTIDESTEVNHDVTFINHQKNQDNKEDIVPINKKKEKNNSTTTPKGNENKKKRRKRKGLNKSSSTSALSSISQQTKTTNSVPTTTTTTTTVAATVGAATVPTTTATDGDISLAVATQPIEDASNTESSSNTSESTKVKPTVVVAVPCTPHSFPPSPSFRADIMARGSLAADDTVFAARDQLRRALQVLHFDPNVRAVAEYLDRRKAIAIFNIQDCSKLLNLSRGGHCVTYNEKILNKYYEKKKVHLINKHKLKLKQQQQQQQQNNQNNLLLNDYNDNVKIEDEVASLLQTPITGSVRAMVPVLHNRYICFQYTLYREPFLDHKQSSSSSSSSIFMPTSLFGNSAYGNQSSNHSPSQNLYVADSVSIGLSTSDMPYDCQDGCGSWIHSIGLSGSGVLTINGKEIAHRKKNNNTTTHQNNQNQNSNLHYGHGSTISFSVFRDNEKHNPHHNYSQQQQQLSCSKVWISIYINDINILSEYDFNIDNNHKYLYINNQINDDGVEMIELIVPKDLVLFPTVTFKSPGWRVNGYFSAPDMISELHKPSRHDMTNHHYHHAAGAAAASCSSSRNVTSTSSSSPATSSATNDLIGQVFGENGNGVCCYLPAATQSVPPDSVVYALDGSVVRYPNVQKLKD